MEKQYVVFKLCNQEYGVDIKTVREISEYKQSTKVPNTLGFVEGLINLRGIITPIISLKKRFDLVEEGHEIQETRIIIINMEDKQLGFMVDDASQVLTLDEKQIDNPPEIVLNSIAQYIIGIGKVDEKIIVLLDLEKVLSQEEKEEIISTEM